MKHKVAHAQVLLDLVKVFDRIPRWLPVREAIDLGPALAPQAGYRHVQTHNGAENRGHFVYGVVPHQGHYGRLGISMHGDEVMHDRDRRQGMAGVSDGDSHSLR